MINLKKMFCGIGKSKILEREIIITKYPFKPSVAYSNKTIYAEDIKFICVEFEICKIEFKNDIVFITSEKKEELIQFSKRNSIKLIPYNWNWNWILEPYLDTEFTKENENNTIKNLTHNGITEQEIIEIREEIGKQMYLYNSMLWEWQNLSLVDVLMAMRKKYNDNRFLNFYKKAINIELSK